MITNEESKDTPSAANLTGNDFPKHGIQLSFVRELLYTLFGGEDVLTGKTTSQLCELHLKQLLQGLKCSFCDYLKINNHPAVFEQAQVFVSHTWSYQILDVLDALEYHFRDQPDIVIWFDVFCINQLVDVVLEFDWWSTIFRSAIKGFGYTVMVLAPWDNPIPLTRSWCLFELWSTAIEACRFEVAMRKDQQDAFIADLSKDIQAVKKMLGTIDVEHSKAFKIEDQKNIFEAVKQTTGFVALNQTVLEKLREWVIATAENAAKQQQPEDLTLQHNLATMYADQGNFNKAAVLYEECLEKERIALRPEHVETTLSTMNNLANVYMQQGDFDRAVALSKECLEMTLAMFGANSPEALTSMNNLATMYLQQDSFDRAVGLYEECLEKMRVVVGDNHPNTLSTMYNLASAYRYQRNFHKAEIVYEECLEKLRVVLAPTHPQLLCTMNDLVGVYILQGNCDKAIPLSKEYFEKRQAVFGINHPSTLLSMRSLANLYLQQGNMDKVMLLYEDCLEKMRIVFGDNHPNTLSAMNNLTNIYLQQGSLEKAAMLREECLRKQRVVVVAAGRSSHPDTIS
jgi:tetratricopeptide (TPR) repeat protein